MVRLLFDIEADGLLNEATELHCMAIVDIDNPKDAGQLFVGKAEIKEGLALLRKADCLIGHNIIGYDLPLLSKLVSWDTGIQAWDTMLISQMCEPDRRSGHSLEGWAKKFGMQKVENEDWSIYTEHMGQRCLSDVRINRKVFLHLEEQLKVWDYDQALDLEHRVAKRHALQVSKGVLLNKKLAIQKLNSLKGIKRDLEREIMCQVPLRPTHKWVTVSAPFTGAGVLSSRVAKHFPGLTENNFSGGEFNKIKWEEMNIDSHKQVKDFLLTQGWVPDTYNEKKAWANGRTVVTRTSPKITESSLRTVETKVGQLIGDRHKCNHRIKYFKWTNNRGEKTGWLNKVREDGRIEAGGLTLGTNTARYTHTGVVNVIKPKASNMYSDRIRQCLTVPSGYKMVGCDATALEARVEAHFLEPFDGGQAVRDTMDGNDVHQKNADAFSEVVGREVERDLAKNGKYCLPMDTRVLTQGGWKYYHDVSVGDMVMGYDQELGVKRWTPVTSKVFFHDQEVITISAGHTTLMATSEHRWLVIEDQRVVFRTTSELNTESEILMDVYGTIGDEGTLVLDCHGMSKEVTSVEDVFCLTTGLGSFAIRQGDTITLTGNCLAYGGGAQKLANTLGVPERYGKELYDAYWSVNLPSKLLKDSLIDYMKSNGDRYIVGIDGRRVWVRSPHSSLNALFQSTGSIIVKRATIMCFDAAEKAGLDASLVLHQHDEFQAEVLEADVEKYCKIAEESFTQAGKYYKMVIPFNGEAMAGDNWSETH